MEESSENLKLYLDYFYFCVSYFIGNFITKSFVKNRGNGGGDSCIFDNSIKKIVYGFDMNL